MQEKLVLLELNEVPFRVIDSYCRRRPHSYLSQVLSRSRQYVSITEDQLALDPWISWPTLHRGVHDEVHEIFHLGQVIDDADADFPPVWRLLKDKGLNVGVFGSLHSSNVPSDASNYSFYLPDYFDSSLVAYPAYLLPFQELNLSMTRQSSRNVSRRIPASSALKFVFSAPRLGLRFGTLVDLVGQLIREAFDPKIRIRRRVYQPMIMMDLFLKQLTVNKPEFACFYTNHVAAAMHRYWGASFPEDYGSQGLDEEWIQKYKGEIWFAMDKFDLMLGKLQRFIDENQEYKLIVASSMGQAAIPSKKTYDFLTITDMPRFMKALGVPENAWKLRPSMVPCCSVVVDEQYRAGLTEKIRSLCIGDKAIQRDKKPVGPLSFDERQDGYYQFFVQFDSYRGADSATMLGTEYKLEELGLGLMVHEDGVNCTAQHVPEGAIFVYPFGGQAGPVTQRETISTLDVVPSILKFFGLETPIYMRGSSSIDLKAAS